jgi:hypothetical protein
MFRVFLLGFLVLGRDRVEDSGRFGLLLLMFGRGEVEDVEGFDLVLEEPAGGHIVLSV